jgi:hypothetical protein
MGFHVVNVTLYITFGPEFGANLHGKKLIFDKSLYDLKTSPSRFHEHFNSVTSKIRF